MIPDQVPAGDLDAEPAKAMFRQVASALKDNNYDRATELASATLYEIQRLQIVTTLDHRAYAFAMQSRFDDAINDAKRMIQYYPTNAKGYIRLGWIYVMQGKQAHAIDTFDTGLKAVSMDDQQYTMIYRLKLAATDQRNKLIDFVCTLPHELADMILCHLPIMSKFKCWAVSKAWREKLVQFPTMWSTLPLDDDRIDPSIVSVLPYIAHCIRTLTIDSNHLQTCFKDFQPRLSENPAHIAADLFASTVAFFSLMKNTLTTLSIDFRNNQSETMPVTVAQVLSTCHALTKLQYYGSLALSSVLGDLSVVLEHQSLIDLELEAKYIIGGVIEFLLQRCTQIRRLILYECLPSALTVIQRYCRQLEILGYNPERTMRQDLDTNVVRYSPGLRAIYSAIERHKAIPTEVLMPMLSENMETLETVYAGFFVPEGPFDYASYSNLKLDRLKSLLTAGIGFSDHIEHCILQAIPNNRALTFYGAFRPRKLSSVIDKLMTLPPTKELLLEFTKVEPTTDANMIRLFHRYSTMSHTMPSKLEKVVLSGCPSVTDKVLATLAQVSTIKAVGLPQLHIVTSNGLQTFLESLGGNVTYVKLGLWDTVKDHHLSSLSKIQNLDELCLDRLSCISDYGVMSAISRANRLRSLSVLNCQSVTNMCLNYANSKVKVEWKNNFNYWEDWEEESEDEEQEDEESGDE